MSSDTENNLPPAYPGVEGTFRQNGRELEGARFAFTDATANFGISCLYGHPFTQAAEPPNGVVCREPGCPFVGVVYVPEWPRVRLVAVQDREETGQEVARSNTHTDAAAGANEVTGEFSFSRERGLSFACHSLENDFDLTKLALLALKEEVERQLLNEEKCPFSRSKPR